MPGGSKDETTIYRLRLTLAEIEPPIWRRIEVPASTTLAKLHRILQAVMGWLDYHLHIFETEHGTYSEIDPDDPWSEDVEDEKRVRRSRVLPEVGSSLVYTYDMGDGWEHVVEVEAIDTRSAKSSHAVCLDGRRNRPPEDCGGPWGYQEFLEAIADPDHPEHQDMMDWIGGAFDPEAFDLEVVNRTLRRVR